jgi:hypothetical protein
MPNEISILIIVCLLSKIDRLNKEKRPSEVTIPPSSEFVDLPPTAQDLIEETRETIHNYDPNAIVTEDDLYA